MEVITLICGIILGFILACLVVHTRQIGTLHIVNSHLESSPQLLLDLDYPIETFMDKKSVMVRVDHISTRK